MAPPTWVGETDGDWLTGTNWDSDTIPAAGQTVIINNGGIANQPTLGAGDAATVNATNISAGTLTIDGDLTSSTVTLSGSGILTIGGAGSVTGNVGMGSSGTLGNSGTITGSVTQSNGVFNNAGAVTGATTVSGGTLNLNSGSDLSNSLALTVNTGGVVSVDASDAVGSLGGTGGLIGINSGRSLTVGGSGFNSTYSGDIAGTGTLVKSGGATLTLNGISNLIGALSVNQGSVSLTGAGSIASTSVAIAAAASLVSDGNAIADTATVTSNGTFFVSANETIGGLQGSGVVDLLSLATLTTGNAASNTFSGAITGSGGIIVQGTGVTSLTGANTFSAGTVVQSGTLRLLNGSAVLDTGTVVVNGGLLEVLSSETIGSLSGAGGAVEIDAALGNVTLIAGDAGIYSYSGTITGTSSGVAAFTKQGTGALTVTGAVITDAVTVLDGTLVLTNAGNDIGSVAVEAGAVLAGSAAGGAVSVSGGGTLTPGSGTGVITTGELSLKDDSTLAIEIEGPSAGAGGYDQVDVTGLVSVAGANLDVSFLFGFTPTVFDVFRIIDNDGAESVSGEFLGLAQGATFTAGGQLLQISYTGGDGNDVELAVLNQAPTDAGLSSSSVQEFRANGTVVGTLSATDPNDGETFTYTLLNSAGGRFAIVGDQVRVANGLLLDFEQASSHAIVVRVTDAGGQILDKTLSILVGDVNPEVVTGDGNANTFFGGSLGDTLNGGGGVDTLVGLGGTDTLNGGAGADAMTGGDGNDVYVVDNIADTATETNADKTIGGYDTVLSSVTFSLGANIESLQLTGTADIVATANDLNNYIVGNSGANRLNGRGGIDTMVGGDGDDVYVIGVTGDNGTETNAAVAGGYDTLWSFITITAGANFESIQLQGGAVINATGNALSNYITGNSVANVLAGGQGFDQLMGNGGNDTFYFGALNNSTNVIAGADRILDFTTGDKIHVANIDANTGIGGDQAFVLDAGGAFSAGEYRVIDIGADLQVEFNVDGGAADMVVRVMNTVGLANSDFIL